MHRSGTSLLGEVVHRWGAHAGNDGQLQAGDAWNARGYWEYLPLQGFNDELLAAAGASWMAPPADRASVAALAGDMPLRARALKLLADMDRAGPVWFWKDPRLPALLPFWEDVWENPVFVVPLRHPLDIARSLEKRDRLALPAALLLWQYSMLAILGSLEGNAAPWLFVSYEEMLREPEAQCARVFAFLDANCPGGAEKNDAPRDPAAAAGAVDGGLRHHESPAPFGEAAGVTPEQKALDELLGRKLADPDAPFDPAGYPLWPGWHDYLATIAARKEAELTIGYKENHIREIRRSFSYRLGRALTKPFRLLGGNP
jgi:hypothetical protein